MALGRAGGCLYEDACRTAVFADTVLLISSTPAFWLALLLAFDLFSLAGLASDRTVGAHWRGIVSGQPCWIGLHHAILPALTLSITGVANIALHTREKMVDVTGVRLRSCLPEPGENPCASIVWRHGLREGGAARHYTAVCLHQRDHRRFGTGGTGIFLSRPGAGRRDSGLGSDLPLLLGITVITAAIVFAGNLVGGSSVWRGGSRRFEGGRP